MTSSDILIGSLEDSFLRIQSKSVSRKQACIKFDETMSSAAQLEIISESTPCLTYLRNETQMEE